MESWEWSVEVKTFYWLQLFYYLIHYLCNDLKQGLGTGKIFSIRRKQFGIPILKPQSKSRMDISKREKLLSDSSSSGLFSKHGFLFRMRNRFTSTMEAGTCSPVRYVKEIDQGGPLVRDKNYLQTITFDYSNKKVSRKRKRRKKGKKFSWNYTYDPLSMFARYYLKEEIIQGRIFECPSSME